MFKKVVFIALLSVSSQVLAEAGVGIGFTYSFKNGFGLTLKLLSNNEIEEYVVGIGPTYYPFSEKHFGLDIGIGFTSDLSAGMLGFDPINEAAVISALYLDTEPHDSRRRR